MRQRVITAVVALIIFIPIILLGGVWIDVAAILLAIIGLSEIFIMRKRIIISPDFFISSLGIIALVLPDGAFEHLPKYLTRFDIFAIAIALLLIVTVLTKNRTNIDDIGINTLAIVYIGNGFHSLVAVRGAADGLALLGYILVVIWATDIGAYSFGRKIGKHKLWPAISPNKTWEGSIAGTLCALVGAAIYLYFFPVGYHNYALMLLVTLIFSIFGQMGDLVESAYKRYYGVKDSGKILPGHGGILDRFDSLLFVLPMMHWFGLL
ncbi:phosphatidate cytidylyltransferase [Lapidilactobacillus wuchangensis]|uniref:phosphatidate cytidylyltransferase n=1 Tax=Lapidilactobacillus wuchangensis TaxID=2486001 RepID=UPI000F77B1FF|nr:phosphatidate cytidylyltransferase [Lapidilactobacillus wuchangensis]